MSNHKLVVPIRLEDDHPLAAQTKHEMFVMCSECLCLADPQTGLAWRQDATRVGLDCPRSATSTPSTPGAIPPDLTIQIIRNSRLPSSIEVESERKDAALRLGDPMLKVPHDPTRPSVQTLIDSMAFEFLHSAIVTAAAIVESVLGATPAARTAMPEVRMDKVLGCVPSDLENVGLAHLPMAAFSPADMAAAAAGTGGGDGGPAGVAATAGAGAGATPASTGAVSRAAASSAAGGGGTGPPPRARPPPHGAVFISHVAAVAFMYRQALTAKGLLGLAQHASHAVKAWSAASTSAYTVGPDGSMVPVGMFWQAVRNCLDNDNAVRVPSAIRVPPTSFDQGIAPIASAAAMVAHGANASIVQWMPRLGLLLSSRRHPPARALLAATWREWHEALLAAAAATRKEHKSLGITAPKRRRDGDADGADPAPS